MPDSRLIALGGEVVLHGVVQGVLQLGLLAGIEPAAPGQGVVPVRRAVVLVLQGQDQQEAVVPLPGPDAQLPEGPLGVVRHVLVPGVLHHVHGDLGSGLGEEGGVHSLDELGGVLGDHPALVVNEVQKFPGEGRRGLPGLSQGNARQNGQDHDRRRHRAFLQEVHRLIPLS